MRILLPALLLLLGGALFRPTTTGAPEQPDTSARLRYPVALALAGKGRWLFAANQRGGSISMVDTQTQKVVGEVGVGRALSDLAVTPDSRHLLAVDEVGNELIVLARHEADVKVRQRMPMPSGPVAVLVSADGKLGFVASQWARQLTIVDLGPLAERDEKTAVRVLQECPLPYAPRKLLLLPDTTKLVLADAFGGRLAVFDSVRREVESVRSLPAHNLRGLAVSADRKFLLVAHQVLHRLGETTRDNVHWGNVITNNLRALPLTQLLDPRAELLPDSRLHQLGEAGQGNGDPSGVAVVGDTQFVTLGGTGEVAVGPDRLGIWQRLQVGHRPTAILTSPDGRHAYVANTFSDSITMLDVRNRSVLANIALGAQPALTARDRGEHLFYNARLSHDGWLSCHSCHTDGHTNGLVSDTLGDGSFGAPKRVLSLLGVKDTAPYAWNGSMSDLPTQVRKSVASTMYGPKLSDAQVQDLTDYLHTLAPPPPGQKQEPERVRRGKQLFEQRNCTSCHTPPTYTSAKTYDVGLKDEMGQRQFNPPSLRGVVQGSTFFHDGRAATLEEVFTRHGHQLQGELASEELRDLLAFLRSL